MILISQIFLVLSILVLTIVFILFFEARMDEFDKAENYE